MLMTLLVRRSSGDRGRLRSSWQEHVRENIELKLVCQRKSTSSSVYSVDGFRILVPTLFTCMFKRNQSNVSEAVLGPQRRGSLDLSSPRMSSGLPSSQPLMAHTNSLRPVSPDRSATTPVQSKPASCHSPI